MGHDADRRGLNKAARLIFTSDWAAKSAVDDYQCDAKKIQIVPLGANVEGEVAEDDLDRLVRERLAGSWKLLLIGVDWERKGCEFAVAVLVELRRRGVSARLDIVGCNPPSGFSVPEGVICHGFMNKRDSVDVGKLRDLLLEATMLISPAKAECQGIVFNEAAAFGLPVIATDTGGIGSVVCNGVTGILMRVEALPVDWCDRISQLCSDEDGYRQTAANALLEFRARLSWKSSANRVSSILDAIRVC
jgi:glycosyltransferase involved in cell wall biosynthesis